MKGFLYGCWWFPEEQFSSTKERDRQIEDIVFIFHLALMTYENWESYSSEFSTTNIRQFKKTNIMPELMCSTVFCQKKRATFYPINY